jgi:3-oxoacyl-[acyl-carrier-protein] synthase II
MKKIAITGLGMLSGLGSSVEENWTNLLAGKTAIKEIAWPEDNPKQFPKTHKAITVNSGAPCPIPEFEISEYGGHHLHWDPCVKIAVRSAEQAIKDSKLNSKNIAVVYSTVGGSLGARAYLSRNLEDGRDRILPRRVIQSTLDYISGVITRHFQFNGLSTCVNSACSTGLLTIDYAVKSLLTDDTLDAVLVGGADTPIEGYQYYYFQNLGALSYAPADVASRPFDKNRSGFVAGEAAGAMMLEPLEKAQARGAKIYGIIAGIGTASAGNHDTSPDKDGEGARQAVIKAVKNAGIDYKDIGYINAHATGTIIGDDIEFYAMRDLFPGATMISNKGQLGHTLGASGIIESIFTVLALKNNVTPPNINFKDPIDSGMFIPVEQTALNTRYAIKNNFAFSGRCASIVFEKVSQ